MRRRMRSSMRRFYASTHAFIDFWALKWFGTESTHGQAKLSGLSQYIHIKILWTESTHGQACVDACVHRCVDFMRRRMRRRRFGLCGFMIFNLDDLWSLMNFDPLIREAAWSLIFWSLLILVIDLLISLIFELWSFVPIRAEFCGTESSQHRTFGKQQSFRLLSKVVSCKQQTSVEKEAKNISRRMRKKHQWKSSQTDTINVCQSSSAKCRHTSRNILFHWLLFSHFVEPSEWLVSVGYNTFKATCFFHFLFSLVDILYFVPNDVFQKWKNYSFSNVAFFFAFLLFFAF